MTVVVKLGGSLAHDPALKDWLDMLAEIGGGRVVIVPGGGPFADEVRALQQRWRFSDATGHAMAILAMEQYGLMLSGMCAKLTSANSFAAIKQTLRARQAVLWLPAVEAISAPDLPQSWDVSSDSLAAWLARKLQARTLLLVKSCDIPDQPSPALKLLAERAIVDRAFETLARDSAFDLLVLNRRSLALARDTIRGP